MTIDEERPEHELHDARVSEMLTVVALVFQDLAGGVGSGTIPCPVCKGGTVAYSVIDISSRRKAIRAACSTPGCVRFMS